MNEQKKEYQVINLFFEYGSCLDGCNYAIASDLDEETLRVRYKEELERYQPYIYLTSEQGEVIVESNRNDAKYRMRALRKSDAFGYEDGVTEIFHGETSTRTLEDALMERYERAELFRIYARLNEQQRRRIWVHVVEGKSKREIAEQEGVSVAAIHYSIQCGLKKMKKFFQRDLKI